MRYVLLSHWLLIGTLLLCAGFGGLLPTLAIAQTEPPEAWYPVTSLPIALADRNAVIHNNFLYVIGGQIDDGKNGSPLIHVYRAAIGPGVELAPTWVRLGNLVRPRHNHATMATDRAIYTVGGITPNNLISESIYRAQFLENGALGAWGSPVGLPTKLYAHDAAILDGYLYFAGGADERNKALNDVYYNQINADGSMTRRDYTTSLPYTLLHHTLIGYGNWLYVIGGREDANIPPNANIYRASILADGSLGPWRFLVELPDAPSNPQPNSKPRFYSEALVRDGRLFVLGGATATTNVMPTAAYADVISAPFNADGTLGDWQAEPSLPEPRYRFGAALGDKGQIYVTGGLSVENNKEVYHDQVYVLSRPPQLHCQLVNAPLGQLAPQATVTYTATCRVTPTFAVESVSVAIAIPPQITFQSAEQGGSVSADNRQVVWQLNGRAPAEEFSVTYYGTYNKPSEPAVVNCAATASAEFSATDDSTATADDPPLPAVVNCGATATWQFMGNSASTVSNLVVNGPLQIYLATILK